MEANELRIGNYATDSIQTGAITVFNNDACVLKHKSGIVKCRISDLSPVPLTEEWLLKFGFENFEDNNSLYQKDLLTISICGNIFIEQSEDKYVFFRNKIHSIHQLQNLYFALTGEELTSKSE